MQATAAPALLAFALPGCPDLTGREEVVELPSSKFEVYKKGESRKKKKKEVQFLFTQQPARVMNSVLMCNSSTHSEEITERKHKTLPIPVS